MKIIFLWIMPVVFFLTSIQFPASGSPYRLLEMPALPNVMEAFVRNKALAPAWPNNSIFLISELDPGLET